jgi:asparagine synthase (glutamine-hydrolysing)
MCGIAGFYNTTVAPGQVELLMRSLDHRGPDSNGKFLSGNIGLLHTRLSIIDLSSLGAQPYRFNNLVLVYNGELYNYKEVRDELLAHGYTFQSNSDSEVLIKAFDKWREKCVDKFVGMFAFGIYEETSRTMWLFRDRVGVKPLYYCLENGRLTFASELKSLRSIHNDTAIDMESVYYYFRFGFVPGHRSIFTKIRKLPAAHYLKMTSGSHEVTRYWKPVLNINHSKREEQWIDELEAAMQKAFQYRMVADVPVGVFLSGGVDSSLLTAILQKTRGDIHAFTVGFDEPQFDESDHAKKVAEYLKVSYTEEHLRLSEAKSIFERFYDIYDEPFADTSGIPMSFVAGIAKESGAKVVLSADGGDELFGGYTHYQSASRLYQRLQSLPRFARGAMAAGMAAAFPKSLRSNISFLNFEHKTYALDELLSADDPTHFFEAYIANQSNSEIQNLVNYQAGYLSPSGPGAPVEQMMNWDLTNYLPDDLLVKVDRATMYHGIECRDPFLDHRLVEMSMTMPLHLKIRNGESKYILKKLLNRYLPPQIIDRPKRGFSIPIFQWFSNDLDRMFASYFDPANLKKVAILNEAEVTREYRKYLKYKQAGKQYNVEKMWRILSFLMWWEKYIDHAA